MAIVAAEKSAAFELSVIHYIHVINANAGRAFLSLYNVCYNLRNESFGHATSHDARRVCFTSSLLTPFFLHSFLTLASSESLQ